MLKFLDKLICFIILQNDHKYIHISKGLQLKKNSKQFTQCYMLDLNTFYQLLKVTQAK